MEDDQEKPVERPWARALMVAALWRLAIVFCLAALLQHLLPA